MNNEKNSGSRFRLPEFYQFLPSRGEVRWGLLFHKKLLASDDIDTLLESINLLAHEVIDVVIRNS